MLPEGAVTGPLWWTAHRDPGIRLDRLAQRTGNRLVLRLGDVVRVASVDGAHVQGDPGVDGQRLEHMPVDDGVVGHRRTGDGELHHELRFADVDEVRPPGQVDRRMRQRLVHRDERITEAPDALLVTQRLPERAAQHDGGVLDGVVALDVDVTAGGDGQVELA